VSPKRSLHVSRNDGRPDKGIPLDLFNKAECIVIIPGVKKAAFIVGGKYGLGFVSCRRGESRRFGAPAAIRIEGGSYGLQIGGSSTDVFMLIMNQTGMDRLMADKFTIGEKLQLPPGLSDATPVPTRTCFSMPKLLRGPDPVEFLPVCHLKVQPRCPTAERIEKSTAEI
jgi:Las17-binding protein actin regulator